MNIIFCVSLMANDLITTSQIYSINTGIHMDVCMYSIYYLHHVTEHAV